MGTKAEYKRKTATKKDSSKSKGTAKRRKVSVKNTGKGNANLAIVKKP